MIRYPGFNELTIYVTLGLIFLASCATNKTELYTITRFDEDNKRFFVVIPDTLVYDTTKIKQIVYEIKNAHETNLGTCLSFFTEEKYAGYKTKLFMDEGAPLSGKEIGNWHSKYYLGEFDYKNCTYVTFPVAPDESKKKEYVFNICK